MNIFSNFNSEFYIIGAGAQLILTLFTKRVTEGVKKAKAHTNVTQKIKILNDRLNVKFFLCRHCCFCNGPKPFTNILQLFFHMSNQHWKCYKCFGFNRRRIKIERGDNIFVAWPKTKHTRTRTRTNTSRFSRQ